MVDQYYIEHPPKKIKAFVIVVHTLMFRSSIASPVKSTAQLKPPLKRMDAAPVPYENLKDNHEVEVAAAAVTPNENGADDADADAAAEDPFRTDHIDVHKLVSLQRAPDSPAVPPRRRRTVCRKVTGRGVVLLFSPFSFPCMLISTAMER